jgi:sec-independent protein translocase protein TatA
MFGLGHWELLIILVIALIIFGAGKLPEIGSGMGSAIKNFKNGISSMDKEIKQEPEKIEAGNTT